MLTNEVGNAVGCGYHVNPEEGRVETLEGASCNEEIQERINRFVNETYPKFSKLRNCEQSVFILGTKRSGKSFLINFLLGVKMEYVKINQPLMGLRVVDADSCKQFAPMSNRGNCTKSPIAYDTNDYTYCDTPGFDESTSHWNAFNIHVAVETAKSINSLIFMLKDSDIGFKRGEILIQQLSTLSRVMLNADLKTIKENMIFVINCSNPLYTIEVLEEELENVMKYFVEEKSNTYVSEELQTEDTEFTPATLDKAIQLLSFMKENALLVSNINDQAASNLIMERLSKCTTPIEEEMNFMALSFRKVIEMNSKKKSLDKKTAKMSRTEDPKKIEELKSEVDQLKQIIEQDRVDNDTRKLILLKLKELS